MSPNDNNNNGAGTGCGGRPRPHPPGRLWDDPWLSRLVPDIRRDFCPQPGCEILRPRPGHEFHCLGCHRHIRNDENSREGGPMLYENTGLDDPTPDFCYRCMDGREEYAGTSAVDRAQEREHTQSAAQHDAAYPFSESASTPDDLLLGSFPSYATVNAPGTTPVGGLADVSIIDSATTPNSALANYMVHYTGTNCDSMSFSELDDPFELNGPCEPGFATTYFPEPARTCPYPILQLAPSELEARLAPPEADIAGECLEGEITAYGAAQNINEDATLYEYSPNDNAHEEAELLTRQEQIEEHYEDDFDAEYDLYYGDGDGPVARRQTQPPAETPALPHSMTVAGDQQNEPVQGYHQDNMQQQDYAQEQESCLISSVNDVPDLPEGSASIFGNGLPAAQSQPDNAADAVFIPYDRPTNPALAAYYDQTRANDNERVWRRRRHELPRLAVGLAQHSFMQESPLEVVHDTRQSQNDPTTADRATQAQTSASDSSSPPHHYAAYMDQPSTADTFPFEYEWWHGPSRVNNGLHSDSDTRSVTLDRGDPHTYEPANLIVGRQPLPSSTMSGASMLDHSPSPPRPQTPEWLHMNTQEAASRTRRESSGDEDGGHFPTPEEAWLHLSATSNYENLAHLEGARQEAEAEGDPMANARALLADFVPRPYEQHSVEALSRILGLSEEETKEGVLMEVERHLALFPEDAYPLQLDAGLMLALDMLWEHQPQTDNRHTFHEEYRIVFGEPPPPDGVTSQQAWDRYTATWPDEVLYSNPYQNSSQPVDDNDPLPSDEYEWAPVWR